MLSRVNRYFFVCMSLGVLTWNSATLLASNLFPDARLNDVHFVDALHGWAVGDRGTILTTADGGSTWNSQASDVDATLHSVWFIDKQRGWAVGGRIRPRTLLTEAVVLVTNDGGVTWQQLTVADVPMLRRVKFFNATHGVAAGSAAPHQLSGVYSTNDAGRTWHAAGGGRGWSWSAADFVDIATGAVAGRGLWAPFAQRSVDTLANESPRIRAIHDIVLHPPTSGWAAGDGGLVLITADAGHTWYQPNTSLPEIATKHFNFHAVAAIGTHIWAAGDPGTKVFHSPDAGKTWTAHSTGSNGTIRDLHFVDTRHGIAVGDLGGIAITRDGGNLWQKVHGGATRTPLLVLAAREDALPTSLLAQSAAADGYLAAVEVLFREPTQHGAILDAPHAQVDEASEDALARVHEAALRAGGTSSDRAWRFTLARAPDDTTTATVLAALNRNTDGQAIQRMTARLVRRIRACRPDAIVVGGRSPKLNAEDELLRQITSQAVQAAADATQYIELSVEADLAPWQVKRVFAVTVDEQAAAVRIAPTTFTAMLGSTIGDIAAGCDELLVGRTSSLDQPLLLTHGLSPLGKEKGEGRNSWRHVFDGIELAPGSDGRRQVMPMTDDELQQAQALAIRRRDAKAVLARYGGNEALASHAVALTEGMDDQSAGRLLFQMAEELRDSGQWQPAANAFERFVRQHSKHPLVDAALVWLVQYYAGSETHLGKTEASVAGRATDSVGLRGKSAEKAIAIGKLIVQMRPALAQMPSVAVPLACAYRKSGLAGEADRMLLNFRHRGADDVWQRLAKTEAWLAQPTQQPPKLPIWTCRFTNDRPHLDGILDESFWKAARPAFIKSQGDDASQRPTDSPSPIPHSQFSSAYDREFLYLAIRVPRDGSSALTDASSKPRQRDADLHNRDRVQITLDLDRDLTTAYTLTVDHRGQVHEVACGQASWNPKWYVAHHAGNDTWTIEAAIPLSELSDANPQRRDVWCAALARIQSDGTTNSWHGPQAKTVVPESFGLMIFD